MKVGFLGRWFDLVVLVAAAVGWLLTCCLARVVGVVVVVKVIAVATDCAFARLDDVILGKLRAKVPKWWPEIVLRTAMKCVPTFSELFYGYDISGVNPEEAVSRSTCLRGSAFLVHCVI